MSIDKLAEHLLRNRLIYGGIGTEILAISGGAVLGVGKQWSVITGIAILALYIYFTYINKTAVNKETTVIKAYKDQVKMLSKTLNSLFEYAEDPDLPQRVYNNTIEQSILPLLEKLDFLHDPAIRVSLYSHSEKGFVLLYRHSDDPEFQKKGRAIYPDDEGIIGAAYHKNKGYVANLPNPNDALDEWVNAQLSDGLMKSKNTVKSLTMQSRNLFALPIRSGHDKHMVIVFESLKPNQLVSKTIEKLINSHYGIKLKEDLSMYRDYIEPSPESAKKMRM